MPIVDSHCHVSPSWYEPVECLLFQLDRNAVEQAVLIQMTGQTNNDYQTECARRYPDRLASVVFVDVQRPDAVQTLEQLAREGATGVRLRPTTRSVGADPLAIWRAAERLDLAISCFGTPEDLGSPGFLEVLQAVPDLPIVIEHLGGLRNAPDGTWPSEESRQKIFALARFPNTYVKIHGLGEFCTRAMPVTEPFPFVRPIPPLLEEAYAAFGAGRIMWGSDYPPVSTREGYHNALRLTMDQLAGKSQLERERMFGDVARKVFRVGR